MKEKIADPQVWMYKCNDSEEAPWPQRGDWARFFSQPGKGIWGGEWSTKNPESKKIIRERMSPGDLVLCYQTDRREMVGICELVRFVHSSRGPRKGRELVLRPAERFRPPVKIHDLKDTIAPLKTVRALQPGPKMLYEVNNEEARVLLSACGSRLKIPTATGGPTKPKSGSKHVGGGFGSPAENRKVEQRAIKLVKQWYKEGGYKVISREKENIGYDLECSKLGEEIHVEVKGSRRSGEGFPITEQEYSCMKTDPKFVLAVVGNALSSRPTCRQWKGQDATKAFDFRKLISVSYLAKRKHE